MFGENFLVSKPKFSFFSHTVTDISVVNTKLTEQVVGLPDYSFDM